MSHDEINELNEVYNRLQTANKIIAELVVLLEESNSHRDPVYYNPESEAIIATALHKYGDINGD